MSDSTQPEMQPLTRVQVLVAMGVTAIVLLVLAKLWVRLGTVETLPLYWEPAVLLWGGAIGAIVISISALLYRFWPAYRDSARYYLELVLKPLVWPDLIWLGLLPGMSEELLFRGVMLPAIGLTPVGVAVSSACFGALHLSGPRPWPYVLWATVVGVVLGTSAIAAGNLMVPIAAHIAINLVSAGLWKWGDAR